MKYFKRFIKRKVINKLSKRIERNSLRNLLRLFFLISDLKSLNHKFAHNEVA